VRGILWTLALIPALLVAGALLGAVQHAWYRSRVRAGSIKDEDVPFFGALLLRGLALSVALLAAAAIASHVAAGSAS
jgi:hypothetical protein